MITSKDNPAVKALKKRITSPKRSDDIMIIEGVHACQMFLAHGGLPHNVWVAEGSEYEPEVLELSKTAQSNRAVVQVLANAVFRDISTLTQGVSILFEVERPQHAYLAATGNVLMLDGVQDPGNMGSILRSAAAAGVSDVFLNDACANPFSPKVLRAAVGAHFALRIVENVDFIEVFDFLKQQNIAVVATSSHAASDLYDLDLSTKTAWLFGNEGAGVAENWLDIADARAMIPMNEGESLNVAAAAAVCLFEMRRQQR